MRSWLLLLGGLLAWTASFFAHYLIASLWPGQPIARWLMMAATVATLAAALWLLARAARAVRRGDDLDRWLAGASLFGCALASVAILYQGLPVLLG